jgi:SAM-dependent methyltransferase
MSAPHPTRIVRFHLLAVLLGVSIPFAVEDLIRGYSTSMLLAETAFLLTALNFFHGKVVMLEDEDYNNALTDRPLLALIDYGLNVLVILCFVFMAFFLDKPGRLVIANLALRTLDTILVVAVRSALPRDDIRKAQNAWLLLNIGAIVSFLVFAWIYWPVSKHHLATSVTFLIIILADIFIDYSVNRKIYFSMADNWDEMARFWDAVQGEGGDIYRHAIIIPALLESANLDQSKHVLDAGCGNGCVSRALAKTGATVVGVDSSEKHLEIATSYSSELVSYQLVDLNKRSGLIEGQPFDVAVLCFTLQDCDTIETPLVRISQNMKPNGKVIVVFENDRSFKDLDSHSTVRRWLSPPKLSGRGRRQLIVWEPHIIRSLQVGYRLDVDEIEAEWTRGFKTVTRHWNISRYIDAAKKSGLSVISTEDELPVRESLNPDDHESMCLRNYRRRPRFGMLVFQRLPSDGPALGL